MTIKKEHKSAKFLSS